MKRFIAPATLGAALVLAALAANPPRAPSPAEVRARYRRSDAVLLDRRGEVLSELRVDARGRRLDWVPLERISPALVSAVIAAEDRRFYSHLGVDLRAMAAAALGALRGRPRGASTITMQLAGRIDAALAPRSRRRSLTQKWRQLRLALAIERSWSKNEILEAYFNLSHCRGELQGIDAISRGLFRKAPHGLDARESLVLAVLLREPSAASAIVRRRAEDLAGVLGIAVDPPTLRVTAERALERSPLIKAEVSLAPQAAQRLLIDPARGAGPRALKARSTLDARLQRFALEALGARLREISAENVSDGAVLVADNATGEVLAYVGNPGASSSARYVDGIMARRQAGSALKPFLYALAFDRRMLTAASLLDDSPLEILAGRGLFRPNDYDNRFRGPVTARQALASSVNVPAVRVLGLVGQESFVGTLSRLGFSELMPGEFYGPSLALGTADVTLWELVTAFRALVDGGRMMPLSLEPGREARRRRVFSREAAYLVADILSDRESRSMTFGLESPLATPYWTAVKTGTSKDMRDNWCVGFSERFTVGVWVGNFSGKSMWNVSGVSGAAPLWRDLMDFLHEDVSGRAPRPPAGLTRAIVRPLPALEPRPEWFLRGTEPAAALQELASPRARILEPVSGTIVAIDPDIPPPLQRVLFRADGAATGSRWRLDAADLGAVSEEPGWEPRPGRHRLSLVDANGRALDSTDFEVRGQAQADVGSLGEAEEDQAAPPEL